MKYFKIENFMGLFNEAQYKGLDIDKIIGGSQIITSDMRTCIIATSEEDILSDKDLIELTEHEYLILREEIELSFPKSEGEFTKDDIQQLKLDNAELIMKQALQEVEVNQSKEDIGELMIKVAMLEMGGIL